MSNHNIKNLDVLKSTKKTINLLFFFILKIKEERMPQIEQQFKVENLKSKIQWRSPEAKYIILIFVFLYADSNPVDSAEFKVLHAKFAKIKG